MRGDKLYRYELPPQPVNASPDPTAPGGLRWSPRLAIVPDATQPPGWRYVPELYGVPVSYALSPDRRWLWLEGANLIDCAVAAVWLRGWLPADVPLVAMMDDMFIPTVIFPDTTIATLARRMLEDNRPAGDDGEPDLENDLSWVDEELGLTGSPSPNSLLPDVVMADLLRQVLGEEAEAFIQPTDTTGSDRAS